MKVFRKLRTFFHFLGGPSPHPDEKRIGIRKAWNIAGILKEYWERER